MPADYEHQLLGMLQRISSQLDDVVEHLESIEQRARAQGAAVGEGFDDARARIARERIDAAGEQEHAIDAVRRSRSEHDSVAE